MTPTDLKARRLALGLTQRALATRLGVTEQTVWRWESARWPIEHPRMLFLALVALAGDLWTSRTRPEDDGRDDPPS